MRTEAKWIKRWGIWISSTPTLPGVWRRKEGGHLVRARVTDPRSGKLKEVFAQLHDEPDPKKALVHLERLKDEVRAGAAPTAKLPRWSDFAVSLFESKLADRTISTNAGRRKWKRILGHLLAAPWADWYLDKVRHRHLVEWRDGLVNLTWVNPQYRDKTPRPYEPSTLNDWLNIGRVIWTAAKHRFELPTNPMDGVADFSTAGHRTYTVEEPNSLTPDEVSSWLALFRQRYPQHYAMVFLGLVLGHRPSTLRPLRRSGPNADVDWTKGVLLVRRSNTHKTDVEDFTKTKRDQVIPLPPIVMQVLRWHVKTNLTSEAQKRSELLFPTLEGGFRSRSCLDKPFALVTREAGLTKRLTPRALRRTFQDLTRDAMVSGVVTKAISGHATDAMRVHYSTAHEAEVLAGITKVAGKVARCIHNE